MNEKGELPPNRDIWQFNLHFSLADDMFSAESVDLLKIAGFDFNRHQVNRFDWIEFNLILPDRGYSNGRFRRITDNFGPSGWSAHYLDDFPLMLRFRLPDQGYNARWTAQWWEGLLPIVWTILFLFKKPKLFQPQEIVPEQLRHQDDASSTRANDCHVEGRTPRGGWPIARPAYWPTSSSRLWFTSDRNDFLQDSRVVLREELERGLVILKL